MKGQHKILCIVKEEFVRNFLNLINALNCQIDEATYHSGKPQIRCHDMFQL